MARLIDADALLKVLQHRVKGNEDSGIVVGTNNTLCIVEELVRSIPTGDAVPVVHGRWLQTKEPLGWQEVDCCECSNCHESWIFDEDYGFEDLCLWKYCPNCGAKMDLEVKDA